MCSIFLSALPWRRIHLLFGTKALHKCSHMRVGDGVLFCSCSFVCSVWREEWTLQVELWLWHVFLSSVRFSFKYFEAYFQTVKVLCFAEPPLHDHITFSFIPDSFYIGFLPNVCCVCFPFLTSVLIIAIIKCISCTQHTTSLFNPFWQFLSVVFGLFTFNVIVNIFGIKT